MQLDRDVRACVDFFLWDVWAMFRALRTHVRGVDDQCVSRCGPWPCLNYKTASFAEQVYRSRRLQHVSPTGDPDAPFRAAIQANATETTVPMRAVSRTPSTAPGIPAGAPKHGKA